MDIYKNILNFRAIGLFDPPFPVTCLVTRGRSYKNSEELLGKMDPKSKSKRLAFLMVKIIITLGAFWVLFLQVPFHEVVGKMAEANFFLVSASLLTFILIPLLQARRWQILIEVLEGKLSFKRTVLLTWLGLFFSSFLPSSVGGDVAKAWFARHNGFYFTPSIISVGMDRICGVAVILIFILLSTLYYYSLLDEINAAYAVTAVMLGSAGCVIVVSSIIFSNYLPQRLRNKFRVFDQIYESGGRIRQLKITSLRTCEIAVISILGQILQPLKYYILALAIGAQISFVDFLFLTPFVTLAVALPIGIAGWGVREGSMIAIFSIVGADPEDMLAISILSGIVVTIAALPGSISWLLIANARKVPSQ